MATLSTTDVSKKLQFAVTSSFISALGIEPVEMKLGKPRWADNDFPTICEKIERHVKAMKQHHQSRTLDNDDEL